MARSRTAYSPTTRRCGCRSSCRGAGVSRHGAFVKGDGLARRRRAHVLAAGRRSASFDADGDRSLARRSREARCPIARSMRNRLRRCSISAGARCARFAGRTGNTLPRRHPELYHVATIRARRENRIAAEPASAPPTWRGRVDAISHRRAGRGSGDAPDREALARLQALGYVAAGRPTGARAPIPKDRREDSRASGGDHVRRAAGRRARAGASRGTQRRSGQSAGKRATWLYADGGWPLRRGRSPHFTRAIARSFSDRGCPSWPGRLPDRGEGSVAARRTLRQARRPRTRQSRSSARTSGSCSPTAAARPTRSSYLQRALSARSRPPSGPLLPRGGLRAGRPPRRRRGEAAELLRRLPPTAPQRPEVERLLVSRPLIPATHHGKP